MSDIVDRAKELLARITRGPWKWDNYRVPTLSGRGGDPETYEYDVEVLEAAHYGECGCRSACTLELTVDDADAEFIAAAPELVAELVAVVERVESLADRYEQSVNWEGKPCMVERAYAQQLRDALEGK